MVSRVAVIDTGTNSTRLMVADVDDGGLDELERTTEITRLGEGVESDGVLGSEACLRVEGCVDRYAGIIAALGAERTMLIATSSVRDARDGTRFIEALAQRYGFECRVLGGEEEAGLAFAGAGLEVPAETRMLLLDIGGGSTELAVGFDSTVESAFSFQLGCVRVRERFLSGGPNGNDELDRARSHIKDVLGAPLARITSAPVDRVIAVAGTITMLAALDIGLKSYDSDIVHGHVLRAERVRQLLSSLAGMTVDERQAGSLMERGRADVIVAGALIVDEVMELGGIDELEVSENDILDGAAMAMTSGKL